MDRNRSRSLALPRDRRSSRRALPPRSESEARTSGQRDVLTEGLLTEAYGSRRPWCAGDGHSVPGYDGADDVPDRSARMAVVGALV